MFSVFASKDRRANYELLLFMILLHRMSVVRLLKKEKW